MELTEEIYQAAMADPRKTANVPKVYATQADAVSAAKRLCKPKWSYETVQMRDGWLLYISDGESQGSPRVDETVHWFLNPRNLHENKASNHRETFRGPCRQQRSGGGIKYEV